MFLDRNGNERAALHRRVVGDEHPRNAVDEADAGDDPASGNLVAVLAEARQGRELEECRVVIGDHVDAIPHQNLAA